MSSSDFRQIALSGEPKKAERLFRAAVSAFCSLPRPSRREIAQLEDLTLPLFDDVSSESKRYVAAALSECEYAPTGLIRQLANESIDIAAPLLIRSKALSDIDLIALIGRHGMPHARAIARRPGLNSAIADLLKALDRPKLVHGSNQPGEPAASAQLQPETGWSAERVRQQLRSMMDGSARHDFADPVANVCEHYPQLLRTALDGRLAVFQTALAKALEADLSVARALTETASRLPLLTAFKALNLSEERAFLLMATLYPQHFDTTESVRQFLRQYRGQTRDAALETLRGWKSGTPTRFFGDTRSKSG